MCRKPRWGIYATLVLTRSVYLLWWREHKCCRVGSLAVLAGQAQDARPNAICLAGSQNHTHGLRNITVLLSCGGDPTAREVPLLQ